MWLFSFLLLFFLVQFAGFYTKVVDKYIEGGGNYAIYNPTMVSSNEQSSTLIALQSGTENQLNFTKAAWVVYFLPYRVEFFLHFVMSFLNGSPIMITNTTLLKDNLSKKEKKRELKLKV